jgi:hypothetical protein
VNIAKLPELVPELIAWPLKRRRSIQRKWRGSEIDSAGG